MARTIMTGIKNLLAHAQGIRCKRKERVMHLCETLSLGDRRYLALVRVGEQKFLVGAAGSSVSLLTQIPSRQEPESHSRQTEDDALFGVKEYKAWS